MRAILVTIVAGCIFGLAMGLLGRFFKIDAMFKGVVLGCTIAGLPIVMQKCVESGRCAWLRKD